MATVVDSLIITLGLDPKGVDTGMKKAESRLESGVKNIMNNILAPLAGAFAIQQLFSSFLREADALGDLSEAIGVSVKDLDAWGQAAQLSGGSAEGFQGSIRTLSANLAQLATTGGGRAKQFFEALGVKATDAKGKVKPATDVLLDLSDKFEGLSKQEAFGLGQKLGLDQGLITMLQKGRKEVELLVGEMEELSYSQEDAELAGDFNDNLLKTTKSVKLLAAGFFSWLLPTLTKGFTLLKDGVQYLRKHQAAVVAFFTMISAVIMSKLIPSVIALGKAWLKNPMTWVIAAAVALALVLEDLWVYMNGGESALEGLWSKFGDGAKMLEWVKTTGKDLLNLLIEYGPVMAITAGSIKLVSSALNLMGLASKANPIMILLTAIALAALAIIENWDSIVGFFEGVFDSISKTISKWVDTVTGLLPDWLKDLLGIGGGDGLTIKANVEVGSVPQGYGAKYAGAGAFAAYHAGDAIPPALSSGTVDNSTQTTFNQNLTVNAKSDDPRGIARESGAELRTMTNTANNGGGH